MVTRFKSGRRNADTAFEAELTRLSGLVSDLARIGRGVPVEELAPYAPLLENWTQGMRLGPCLLGLATDHPKLPGERRSIVTSDLLLMSDDGQWARTRSRWYRLGRPAGRGKGDA